MVVESHVILAEVTTSVLEESTPSVLTLKDYEVTARRELTNTTPQADTGLNFDLFYISSLITSFSGSRGVTTANSQPAEVVARFNAINQTVENRSALASPLEIRKRAALGLLRSYGLRSLEGTHSGNQYLSSFGINAKDSTQPNSL